MYLSSVAVGDDYDKLEPKKEEEEEKKKLTEEEEVGDVNEKTTAAELTVVVLPDTPILGEDSTTA